MTSSAKAITSIILFLVASLWMPPEARAMDTNVSCSQNGRIVHRETIASDQLERRRIEIAGAAPGAFCVYLKAGLNDPVAYPDEVLPPGITSGDPMDLASALAAIESGRTGVAYPEELSDGFAQAAGIAANEPEAAAEGIGVTVAVYRNVPTDIILAHWRNLASSNSVAERLTPSLAHVDEVTTLSVEGVADTEVSDFCSALPSHGFDCLAIY